MFNEDTDSHTRQLAAGLCYPRARTPEEGADLTRRVDAPLHLEKLDSEQLGDGGEVAGREELGSCWDHRSFFLMAIGFLLPFLRITEEAPLAVSS